MNLVFLTTLFNIQQPQLCCVEENDYEPCLTNNMRPTRGHGLMQCTPSSQYLPFQPMPPNIFPLQTITEAMMKPLLSTNTNTNNSIQINTDTNTNNNSDNMPMPFDNAMDFDFDPSHSIMPLDNMTAMDEALNGDGNGFNTPISNFKCTHCPRTFQHKYNSTIHLKIHSTGSLGAWAAAAVDDQSMLIIRVDAGRGHNYADIVTMDGQSASVDLSLTQKGQIGSSYHHFYVYITAIGDIPCYEPSITLSYERIDYHGGQQLWDIYGPDNIEIMECGASVLAHCTGYEPCLSNYNFGIDAIEPNNTTKLIHLDTWSIDRYCNDLSVNVPVTITCSVPTGYPNIDLTDQPTTSTPTASPTDTTPMPTQSLTPNVTDCGERKTCYDVAITPIPQVQTSINLLLKGSESFKQTIDTTAERNSDEAGTTVIVCVLIVCVVLILSGLIYMKQHCDIFTDFITKADNQLLNGNIHLINVNCNDNNEMESNDAIYISPRTEELIQNIIRRKTTVTVSVTHSAMLRILERELSEHSVECLIYDGSKISEQQNAILDHFRTDPDHMSPVLLMSEKLCHSLPFMVSLTQTCSLTLCTWLDEALSRDEAIERERQTMGKRCVPKGIYFQNHWNRRYISRFKEIRYCVWIQRLEKTFSTLRQRDCDVNSNNVRSEEVTGICMDGHESIRVLNRDKNEQSVAKMLNLGLRQGNVVPTDHVRGMSVELFPHQKKGVAWMLQMEMDRLCKGGVLCDQMGVGKTIQIITLMLENREDARDEAKEKYKSEGYVSESDYCDSVVCNDTCGGFVVRDDENVFRSDNGESEESDTEWSPDMGSNSDKKSKKKIQRGKTRKYCDLESDTEKTVSECDETVEIDKESGLCMDCIQVLVQYKDKLMTIDVQPNDTVKQLKLRIKDREGIHVKDQTLNHGNQQLKDETDCSDITANGDIHLCLNLGLGGGRRIDITIVTNKDSFLLKVDQTCSILELKQHIQSKTGTAPQNQSLLGNGSKRLLEDRRTLDSYGIHADDIIQLTVLNRNNIIAIDDTDEDCDITEIAMNDPKPLKSPSPWLCNICTLENKPLSNLCAMCRTAKAGSTATKMSDEMLARELQKSFNAPSQSHTPNAPMLESSPDLGTQSHKREMRLDSTDTSLFSTLLLNAQIGPFGVITRLDQANQRVYYMPDTNNRNVLKWGYRPPTTEQTWVRERFGDLIDTLPRMNKAQRKQMEQINGNGHYYDHEKYTFNDSNDTIDLSNDNSMNDLWQSENKPITNVSHNTAVPSNILRINRRLNGSQISNPDQREALLNGRDGRHKVYPGNKNKDIFSLVARAEFHYPVNDTNDNRAWADATVCAVGFGKDKSVSFATAAHSLQRNMYDCGCCNNYRTYHNTQKCRCTFTWWRQVKSVPCHQITFEFTDVNSRSDNYGQRVGRKFTFDDWRTWTPQGCDGDVTPQSGLDIAIVKLNSIDLYNSLFAKMQHIKLAIASKELLQRKPFYIPGFPANRRNDMGQRELVTMESKGQQYMFVNSSGGKKCWVQREVDTTEGQSGSPVCLDSDQTTVIFAIHSGGSHGQQNVATPFTTENLPQIKAFIEAPFATVKTRPSKPTNVSTVNIQKDNIKQSTSYTRYRRKRKNVDRDMITNDSQPPQTQPKRFKSKHKNTNTNSNSNTNTNNKPLPMAPQTHSQNRYDQNRPYVHPQHQRQGLYYHLPNGNGENVITSMAHNYNHFNGYGHGHGYGFGHESNITSVTPQPSPRLGWSKKKRKNGSVTSVTSVTISEDSNGHECKTDISGGNEFKSVELTLKDHSQDKWKGIVSLAVFNDKLWCLKRRIDGMNEIVNDIVDIDAEVGFDLNNHIKDYEVYLRWIKKDNGPKICDDSTKYYREYIKYYGNNAHRHFRALYVLALEKIYGYVKEKNMKHRTRLMCDIIYQFCQKKVETLSSGQTIFLKTSVSRGTELRQRICKYLKLDTDFENVKNLITILSCKKKGIKNKKRSKK